MKQITKTLAFALIALFALASCDREPRDGKAELLSFGFSSSANPGLDATVTGTFEGANILVVLPDGTDRTALKASFTTSINDVVTVNGTEIVSEQTSYNYSEDQYTIKVTDIEGAVASYTLNIQANDGKAELLSFGFFAADNKDLLAEDLVPETISSDMIVRMKGGANGKTLVCRFTAGLNDEVAIDGKPAEEIASVDCSFPIDITVTDKVAGTSAQYVVRVGKILELVWNKLGEYEDGGNEINASSGFNMAINPKDNVPYFVYPHKVDGSSIRTIASVKYENNAFVPVGEVTVEKSASLPTISFSKEGVPYMLHVDADNGGAMTVRKLEGSWNVVGEAGFGEKASTSYATRIMVDQKSGTPVALWTGNVKSGYSYRTIGKGIFNGTSWECSNAGLPTVSGSTNATMGCSNVITVGDVQYIMVACNQGGNHLLKLEDKTLSTVMVYAEGNNYASNIGLSADGNKNIYIFALDKEGGETYDLKLYKYADGKMSQMASTIALALGTTSGCQAAVCADAAGSVYVTYVKAGELIFRAIDSETKNWTEEKVLEAADANGKTQIDANMQMAFASNNVGYLAYVVKKNTTAGTPAKLVLYQCKLEDDILPE